MLNNYLCHVNTNNCRAIRIWNTNNIFASRFIMDFFIHFIIIKNIMKINMTDIMFKHINMFFKKTK